VPEVVTMRVVVAPDGFGGLLSPQRVAEAIRSGWLQARPMDQVQLLPQSDGGEGLLEVMALLEPTASQTELEVVGPDARPTVTQLHWSDPQTVTIESARICGLGLVAPERRRPMESTSYGVGQALQHVVDAGATLIRVGLGGSATVDGGSGALNGLGFRLRTEDGSGLRIGTGDLGRCRSVEVGWSRWPQGVRLELLTDVRATLAQAAPDFGPQKGLDPEQVVRVTEDLTAWGRILPAGLGEHARGAVGPDAPGTGAAGGLAFALAVALDGRVVEGAAWIAERSGLSAALATADLVITGEGRLDATSANGKVVGQVVELARASGRGVAAIVGRVTPEGAAAVGLQPHQIETATVEPTRPEAATTAAVRVTAAAQTLARRLSSVH
jgi:glycerate 2-kinase